VSGGECSSGSATDLTRDPSSPCHPARRRRDRRGIGCDLQPVRRRPQRLAQADQLRHLAGALLAAEVSSTDGFDGENLKLVIKNTTKNTTVYAGTFGGLVEGTKNTLGQWAAGEANDHTFTVSLDQAAPNTQQGKSATADCN
jgi:hypothetical protein